MRSRLLSLFGSLALLILVFTSVPAVNAAIDVAKQVLIGSDYSGKDLRGATFNLSNLREDNLSGSDLRGASLTAPSFRTLTSAMPICVKQRSTPLFSPVPTSPERCLKERSRSTHGSRML